MNHNYKAQYKNVLINPLSKDDIEFLREWRNNSDNTRFLSKIPYITSNMQKKWFEKYLLNNDEMCFSIIETDILNRVVGSLSLYNFNEDSAEFGKILIGDVEAHGKNVGYHAIINLLNIAFKELNLKSVFLHVYSENKGAVHIYKKAGFEISDTHMVDEMEEYTMMIAADDFLKMKVENQNV